MKKIVSLMALCAVLFGAVMIVTGCGNKPGSDSVTLAKGTVWKYKDMYAYLCFHSDGHLYYANAEPGAGGSGSLKKRDNGLYSIDSKNITGGGQSIPYTLKGDTLTIGIGSDTAILKKVSSPTEDEIKALPNM